MKKILAIDGNSILNRAFYGVRPLSNREGFPTNALFGAANMIIKQLTALSPDAAVMAYDLKSPTFRHKLYADYKAGRHEMPDELKQQMPVSRELASALGLCIVDCEGYEADDILGTVATLADEDCTVYLLTGDKDSLQLISPHVHVLLVKTGDTVEMDEAAFIAGYGVRPDQFVDVKALMGDSSDHIPGVAGIGEKTACKLIAEYGSLDAVYAALPTAKLTPSLRAKLENGRDSAYLSQTLSRIFCQAPIDLSSDRIAYRGMDRAAAFTLFKRLGFLKLIERFDLQRDREQTNAESATDGQKTDANICKSTLPTVTLGAAEVAGLPSGRYGLWLHAVDSDETNRQINAVLTDGEQIMICDCPIAALQEPFTRGEFVVYDAKSCYRLLDEAGLSWRNCFFDVMLAAYAVNAGQGNFSYERLLSDYLGIVADPNCHPVCYLLPLYHALSEKLQESGQERLLYEIEMPLAGVLCDMEQIGFCIDRAAIRRYGDQLHATAKTLEERIYTLAGEPFNINSPKQLGEVLFERLGLPSGKKTKTGYSTDAQVLENLRKYHPIIDDILEYRQVVKLESTYVEGLLKVADAQGRVHTVFRQTGTVTGRLSSAEPNLQNIPIRTPMGRELRRYFVASDADHLLIDADYSQIELRLLAHISEDTHMIEAFCSGYDIHTATACLLFDATPETVTTEMRKRAKAINFGILYGMGEYSLSKDLHISVPAAKAYITQYLSTYPQVAAYLDTVVKDAYRDGYVTTMFGRRRYIPELSVQNKNIKHFGERVAMNSPIQGSAADLIKLAMIRVDRALRASGLDARLLLQVHDELLVEAHKDCAEQVLAILREQMEQVLELRVPLSVDAKIGENWLLAH